MFGPKSGALTLVACAAVFGFQAWAGPSPGRAPVQGPAVGVPMTPWQGSAGITETVDQIMARELAIPIFETPPPLYVGPEHEVLRRGILLNPSSPRVSQWPRAYGPKALGKGGHGGGAFNPQTIGTNFEGANLSESGYLPPDSNGAVGPTQVLIALNGRVKVLGRNGVVGPLNVSGMVFFNSVRNGAAVYDPQVRFDPTSGRWFVQSINGSTPNRIMLAVSSGPTITGSSSFTFYQFQQDLVAPAGNTGQFADYDSLGVDANAVYVGCNMFGGGFMGSTGWVIKKSSVLSGGPIQVTAFRGIVPSGGSAGPFSPRGVDNDDPAATEGYLSARTT